MIKRLLALALFAAITTILSAQPAPEGPPPEQPAAGAVPAQAVVGQQPSPIPPTPPAPEGVLPGEPQQPEPPQQPTEPALAAAERPEAEAPSGFSLWILIKAGGWVGAIIFILSLAACTLTIQLLVKIRRSVLLPNALIEEFGPLVEKGRLQSALESCRQHPSLLASVLTAGLKNFEAGWDDVEKGAGETLSQETARLYRRNDFLAVIGNIAPMLGLLGTVLGMVAAFGELAASDGLGRFANLAQGIYFALVTTVDGLLVAIPALALYSFFNHRVASISAEAAELATELFRPLKRHFLTRSGGNSGAGTPPLPPSRGTAARSAQPPQEPSK